MESKSNALEENSLVSPEDKTLISEEFQKNIDERKSPDEKIRYCLEYMRQALSHEGKPNFKGFWDVRRYCLPLFKESMHPSLRADLWKSYIDMTEEARRLKGILEEETTFMVEQITLAIDVLENELAHKDEVIKKIPPLELPENCRAIEDNSYFFQDTQREIILFNSFATRVTSLRKELIDCEMRISLKNKLFKRLSTCGDQIFPKRKELMESLSRAFQEDVEAFVSHFSKEVKTGKTPYFILRDEIKHLQNVAKLLNVKTSTFLSTRNKLSECWDKLRELDTRRKEEIHQKKEQESQQVTQVLVKIEELHKRCLEKISFDQADKITDGIFEFMKTLPLSRDDVKELRRKIQEAKDPLYEEQMKEKEAKEKKDTQRKTQVDQFFIDLDTFVYTLHPEDVQEWMGSKEKWKKSIPSFGFNDTDLEKADRFFAIIDDTIFGKLEKSILSSHPSAESLEEQLEKRQKYRNAIKEKLESHRKLVNESRLSFEKSIFYQELLEEEKDRLDHCDECIAVIEEMLEE